MIIYFVTFAIAFAFAYFAEKYYKKIPKPLYIILIFLAFLVPSILAGLREYGVGTDTKGYITYVFEKMQKISSIDQFFDYAKTADTEFLYVLFNFIISRFFTDINVMYFFMHLLLLAITYFGLSKLFKEDRKYIAFFYLIYLLLYFNRSLNLYRQSVAISIGLFSYFYVMKRKLLMFVMTILLGMGFHKTMLLMVPLYFAYPSFTSLKNISHVKFFVIFAAIFGLSFVSYPIINTLIVNGIIDNKYDVYINQFTANLSIIDYVIKILAILIPILLYKKKIMSDSELVFYMRTYCLSLTILGMAFVFGNMQRISYYYAFAILLLYKGLLKKIDKDKYLMVFILVLMCALYSWLTNGLMGWNETVPYRSILGGIF